MLTSAATSQSAMNALAPVADHSGWPARRGPNTHTARNTKPMTMMIAVRMAASPPILRCFGASKPEVSLPHAAVVQQRFPRPRHHDAAVLQDVGAVGDLERNGDVLLD